ncbi:MAG: UDP-N-acetylmuramoyl-L-alanyl-D-glutamate--2,6-diaminopimelate ligase [Elusimicrobiota bacterium]|nr:UDP-N-acetylmuramoyl-L-alanyl-D-glutamate--2,6-diaminopimelate ligase [Elusimicrobiota bacterium]
MKLLKSLIENTGFEIVGNINVEISGITYDSRKVKPKNIFVAIGGMHTDGKNFISDAVKNGAVGIVTTEKISLRDDITQIIVPDTSVALGVLAARFFDFPSKKLTVIGITGTNGKTTITYLLESIFDKAKIPTAVIGTINYRFGNEILNAEITTPAASDLQALFAHALQKQFCNVVMEVSSHSLALNRVAQTEFDVGIFTNLTRDHLDFHKTMEDYFRAKLTLFEIINQQVEKSAKKFAIINIDDAYGRKILECFNNKEFRYPVFTYGFLNSVRNNPALRERRDVPYKSGISNWVNKNKYDFSATNIEYNTNRTSFKINFQGDSIRISTALVGKHNIYNILAAFSSAIKYGIDPEIAKSGIEEVKFIPGRLEKVDCEKPINVFIDYAHTDDALKNVLNTLRDIKHKRIITVFGCGGDRDRSKRPLMGEVAATLSDYVIVTSDNPRTEDPEKIVLDIEVGIRRINKQNFTIIIDREEAIKKAIEIAKSGDIVLIAGKGHEKYQIIGDKLVPFEDKEVVKRFLSK